MKDQSTVLFLLYEAIERIENPRRNANGGTMQVGGAYWRLAQSLKALDAIMDEQEGKDHADFIRKTHGVLVATK